MLYEIYTRDKMRQLEREARARFPGKEAARRVRSRGSFARAAGRMLSRLGTGLEEWAEARPDRCCEICR
jgi:hypothetical protein